MRGAAASRPTAGITAPATPLPNDCSNSSSLERGSIWRRPDTSSALRPSCFIDSDPPYGAGPVGTPAFFSAHDVTSIGAPKMSAMPMLKPVRGAAMVEMAVGSALVEPFSNACMTSGANSTPPFISGAAGSSKASKMSLFGITGLRIVHD